MYPRVLSGCSSTQSTRYLPVRFILHWWPHCQPTLRGAAPSGAVGGRGPPTIRTITSGAAHSPPAPRHRAPRARRRTNASAPTTHRGRPHARRAGPPHASEADTRRVEGARGLRDAARQPCCVPAWATPIPSTQGTWLYISWPSRPGACRRFERGAGVFCFCGGQ